MPSRPRHQAPRAASIPDPDTARRIERVAQEWRASVDATPDVIVMYNAEFRIGRANKAATRFFDRAFTDLLDQSLGDLLAGEVPRGDPFRFDRLRATGKRVICELYLKPRQVWVLSSIDPILDAEGRVVGAVQVIRDITQRKRTDRQLRRSFRELKELSARLERAREEERTAVAREIHDELGHALTAVKMEAGWLGARSGADQEWLVQGLRSVAERADYAIGVVRRLATELRPSVLDDLGIAAALEWQAVDFERRTAIPTRVQLGVTRLGLDREESTALFRVCQEALTNVARHAAASNVQVTLGRDAGAVTLRVADDGKGFRPLENRGRKSLGVLGMRERMQQLGGTLEVRSTPGSGTEVIARLHRRRRSP